MSHLLKPQYWIFRTAFFAEVKVACATHLHFLISPNPSVCIFFSLAGSPFRDEISLAVLQLQENNRLEILKRRWWEGGQCPKEEDHRAKGMNPTCTQQSPSRLVSHTILLFRLKSPQRYQKYTSVYHFLYEELNVLICCRSWDGEHRGYICGVDLWADYCRVCGCDGVCLVHTPIS